VIIPFDKLWGQYERVIKDNGAIVLFAQTPFDKVLGLSNIGKLRYEWIWEKTQATGHLNSKKSPMKAHENLLVFYDKVPTYNPQMTTGHTRKVSTAQHKRNSNTGEIYGECSRFTDYDSTDRYPRSVVLFPSDKQKLNLHPTQKPVALCEYMIKTYTNPGDTVLDSCAGSGTTIVAALNTGRKAIGFENDEEMYYTALERIMLL
jgi:site-specific DNA-methyltransferase (adenine-specific)